jgi:hypothetical protein
VWERKTRLKCGSGRCRGCAIRPDLCHLCRSGGNSADPRA